MAERELDQLLGRIDAYEEGLLAMWEACPNTETRNRHKGFVKVPHLSRIKWIDWVERQAETGSPAWCCELVGMVVAAKLGVK